MAHNPTTDPHNLEGRITFDRGHNPDPPASDCDAGEALDQNNVLIEVLHEVDLFEEDSEVEGRFFQRVERQLKMLRGLAHVNVAEFQGWMVMLEDESWLRAKAVHAGCEGGKVMAYLSINANADRRDLVVGVSRGLSYLHSKGIVHGNLNPSNVHIDYDVQRRPVPRISGFESSYTITDDDSVNLKMEGACSAPLRYIAPEVMAQLGFLCGQKGDVWSFGCTSSQVFHAFYVPTDN
ncbi:kinase-like domain-containing protein [Cantharellus anzutake]|uniref:kinase-like domain-containing protein n=1 Tax=Cantharellus anzutake TaxID=1750568 RepID=UPI0019055B0F|nr:kinase-like domain-containing protein [Cantharellus anzutake]KAF8317503.1 kinase-like domain-containing protein [Cantharellus anzutake]